MEEKKEEVNRKAYNPALYAADSQIDAKYRRADTWPLPGVHEYLPC